MGSQIFRLKARVTIPIANNLTREKFFSVQSPLKVLVSAATLSIFLAACSAPPKKEPPVPEVQVLEAVTRSIPVYTEYIGETYGQA